MAGSASASAVRAARKSLIQNGFMMLMYNCEGMKKSKQQLSLEIVAFKIG